MTLPPARRARERRSRCGATNAGKSIGISSRMYGERSENFREGLIRIRGFGEQVRVVAGRLCSVHTATKQ